MDQIQSGPEELRLAFPLRFRRRTRSNPCSFDDLLEALQANRTIRQARCHNHVELGITESEWCRLVRTLGSIWGLKKLEVVWQSGSHGFHPLQVVARAVDSANSLHELTIIGSDSEQSDPAGEVSLAQSLRQHGTLDSFGLTATMRTTATPRSPQLIAAAACLRQVIIVNHSLTSDDVRCLSRSLSLNELCLVGSVEGWLVIADEIRNGYFRPKTLVLVRTTAYSALETAEAIQVMLGAIQCNGSLRKLNLHSTTGFSDEMGVALAKALTVNTTMVWIDLQNTFTTSNPAFLPSQPPKTLGAEAYKAFIAMLKINMNIRLKLPNLKSDADFEARMQHSLMRIELQLNSADRGSLVTSNQTTREEWVHTFQRLNDSCKNDGASFHLSCVYSMLQRNPGLCQTGATAPILGSTSLTPQSANHRNWKMRDLSGKGQ
jgi:hypothetical protein